MGRFLSAVSICAVVGAGLVPAAASGAATATATPSPVVRMAPATGLAAAPSNAGIRLHWTDPVGASYQGLIVRRSPGIAAPVSPTSGTMVATLPIGTTSMIDAGVEAQSTYTYAVFAMYADGKHAAPASEHARSGAIVAAPASSPSDGSFTGTVTDSAGHPLKGVEVTATLPSPVISPIGLTIGLFFRRFFVPHIARTDAAGHYTLQHLATKSYSLCFIASTRPVTGGDHDTLGYQDVCPQDAVAGHAGETVPLGTTVLPANTGGVISGVVQDAHTGAPIAGVEVNVELPSSFTFVKTDSMGRYRIALPAGNYQLCFDPSFATSATDSTGYVGTCNQESETVVAGQVTNLVVALDPGAVVTGVIRSASDGSPVPGMFVEVQSQYSFAQTITGDDGSYTLTGLAPTRTRICAVAFFSPPTPSAPFGFGSGCVSVRPSLHATVVVPDISLPLAGAVSGRVATGTGQAVPATTVEVIYPRGGYSTLTGLDGTYEIPGIPAGRYSVCFLTPSYPVQCYLQRSSDQRPTPVFVSAGVLTSGIDATLAGKDPGSVAVTVQDQGGRRLISVDVVLVQNCVPAPGSDCSPLRLFARHNNTVVDSVLSDSAGRVSFDGVRPGNYAVCAFGRYATGGTSTTRYQDACTGTTYGVTVASAATSAVTMTLADGAGVSGTVTDAKGRPIAGVAVIASTGDEQDVNDTFFAPAMTGQDGRYRVEGLTGGTTQLCFDSSSASGASKTGYAFQCYRNAVLRPTPISVTNGVVTTGIDVQLKAGGAITGTVTGIGGQPVGGVSVFVDGVTSFSNFTSTAPDGTYRVAGLAAGDYHVCFAAIGSIDAPPTGYADQCYQNAPFGSATPVTVHAGQTVSGIDAALQPGVEFTGKVMAGGQPVQDSVVIVFQRTASGLEGIGTNVVGGGYSFSGLPAGKYLLCADGTADGDAAQCFDGVAWKGGAHSLPAGITKIATTPGQVVTTNFDLTPGP